MASSKGGAPEIQIEGLKELRKGLRAVSETAGKDLRGANKQAAEVALPDARRNAAKSFVNGRGNQTHLGSRGEGTVRVLASQTSASLAAGGARVPYAGGFEWGSSGRYPQFPARSGQSAGFILRPAIQSNQDRIVRVYQSLIGDLVDRSLPD